jgi:Flp pilus assembly protein TadD
MSQSLSSPDAALARALADHRAGHMAVAEQAYRALLESSPRHAGVHHHLGVLLAQTARIEEGLTRLRSALELDPAQPLYYFSLAKAHLAAGDPAQAGAALRQAAQLGVDDRRFDPLKAQIWDAAVTKYRQALQACPDDAVLLDNLGTALLEQGHRDQAVASYRQALAQNPDFAPAHFHLGAALSQSGYIAEGFSHYMRHAQLAHAGQASDVTDPPHKRKHDRAQRGYLWGDEDAPVCFHLADGARIAGPALNPTSPSLWQDWPTSHPQLVVIDHFLTAPALEKLRLYCAGSTVWRKIYPAGYLGAAPEDGFSCPLLAQIVEEIQSAFAPILGQDSFRYLGAFKYDSELSTGTNTHADNSLVNVNFYIAPDEANLDPESGGMEIWDAAAPDLPTMRRLNGSEALAQDYLQRCGAKRTVIAHRANRAVIFKSTQFHKTDHFRFKPDYHSMRINISLLFGQFGGE